MSADKIPQGALGTHIECLSAYRSVQIAAGGTGNEIVRVVLPFAARLLRVEYDLAISGVTGTITALKAQVAAADVTESVNPTTGGGAAVTRNGSLKPNAAQGKVYARGTMFTLIATTAATSTIDTAAATFAFLPVDS